MTIIRVPHSHFDGGVGAMLFCQHQPHASSDQKEGRKGERPEEEVFKGVVHGFVV
jgi:hypothetical protein